MIQAFEGKTETVEIPLCPKCARHLSRFRQFSSTGFLPPDPHTDDSVVYRFGADLWACGEWQCRHPRAASDLHAVMADLGQRQ